MKNNMSNTFPQLRPIGYNKSFSDLNSKDSSHEVSSKDLNAKADWRTDPGQFGSGPSPIPPMMSNTGMNDSVMAFKSSSSNPMDMKLPHGNNYSEFNQADSSMPRYKFQNKVDKDVILKGNPKTAEHTGQAHG